MKHITSAENPHFKALLKLMQSSRERRVTGRSLIEGAHLLQAYCAHVGRPEQVVVSRTGLENSEILHLIKDIIDSPVWVLSDSLFHDLSSVATPTGIIAVIKTPVSNPRAALREPCVLLEDIQDPGNLGSILRSAAAAGIRDIFLSKGCVHSWSPRVLRAGMGAHFRLAITENADLAALIAGFPGCVIATSQRASQSIFETDLTGAVALLFGNEGAGLSRALLAAAHVVAAVPMPGKSDSLNVAAAAAVCLFERVRQTGAKRKRS